MTASGQFLLALDMGSWNDIWFEDESQGGRFREVTEQLYGAVIAAFVAVTNAR